MTIEEGDRFGINAYLIDDTGIIEFSSEYSEYEKVNLFELNSDCDTSTRREILELREEALVSALTWVPGAVAAFDGLRLEL